MVDFIISLLADYPELLMKLRAGGIDWLTLISMSGIVGGSIYIYAIRKDIKNKEENDAKRHLQLLESINTISLRQTVIIGTQTDNMLRLDKLEKEFKIKKDL